MIAYVELIEVAIYGLIGFTLGWLIADGWYNS